MINKIRKYLQQRKENKMQKKINKTIENYQTSKRQEVKIQTLEAKLANLEAQAKKSDFFYSDNFEDKINYELFEENLKNEQLFLEQQSHNLTELYNSNNILPSTYMDCYGYDPKEMIYNYSKSYLNLQYFTSRCSDGTIITLLPFYIDRWVKTNVLFKNIAEIPIIDAFAGLGISSQDPRIIDYLNDINDFIRRQQQDIVNIAIESELYGGAYCMITGDDQPLTSPLSKVNNKRNIALRICCIQDMTITEKEITIFKENPYLSYDEKQTVKYKDKSINKSRFVLFCGTNIVRGKFYKPILKGYSWSIFENLRSCLYGTLFSIEAEHDGIRKRSFDVMTIKGLAGKMAEWTGKIKLNIQAALRFVLNKAQTDNVIITDENTSYQRTSNNINVSQDIEGIAMMLCLYTGIPASRLLCKDGGNNGMQGVGVNANERQYQQKLSKIQLHYYKSLHVLITKIIYILYGITDVDFDVVFEPILEVNETQKLANETQNINNINSLVQSGILKVEEAREKLRELGYLQTIETDEDNNEEEEQEDNEDNDFDNNEE